MAETLRELAVALSPDSSNFSRNMYPKTLQYLMLSVALGAEIMLSGFSFSDLWKIRLRYVAFSRAKHLLALGIQNPPSAPLSETDKQMLTDLGFEIVELPDILP